MNPDAAIERLYDLHPGTTPVEEGSPHERPHKPLLLLAALDLIDEGLATPERIPWCQDLRDRFSARFLLVRKLNDQNSPELPFPRDRESVTRLFPFFPSTFQHLSFSAFQFLPKIRLSIRMRRG